MELHIVSMTVRRRHAVVLSGFFSAVVVMWMSESFVRAEPAWLKEANSGWRRLLAREGPCEYRITVHENITGHGNEKSTGVAIVLSDTDRGLLLFVDGPGEVSSGSELLAGMTFALVQNGRYSFRLERATPQNPWRVVGLGGNSEFNALQREGRPRWYEEYLVHLRNRIRWTPVKFSGVLLPELFASPGVEITETKREGELFRVKFRWEVNRYYRESRCSVMCNDVVDLLLDPTHDWRIVEWRSTDRRSKSVASGKIEYDGDGYPIVERITGDSFRRETRYSDFRFDCRFDESVFRLPAFGIAEPVELQTTPKKWRWYVVAGMLGTVLVIWGIKRRRS